MSLSMYCSKLVCLMYVYILYIVTVVGKVESHLNLYRIVFGLEKVMF